MLALSKLFDLRSATSDTARSKALADTEYVAIFGIIFVLVSFVRAKAFDEANRIDMASAAFVAVIVLSVFAFAALAEYILSGKEMCGAGVEVNARVITYVLLSAMILTMAIAIVGFRNSFSFLGLSYGDEKGIAPRDLTIVSMITVGVAIAALVFAWARNTAPGPFLRLAVPVAAAYVVLRFMIFYQGS